MVAHDEILVGDDAGGAVRTGVGELRGDVRFVEEAAVHINAAAADFDGFAGEGDDALDEGFAAVERIPKNDDVAALDGTKVIEEFVNENALFVVQERGHAGAFNFDGLIKENDDDDGQRGGDEKVAGPGAKFPAERGGGAGRRGALRCGLRGARVEIGFFHCAIE